MNEIRLRLWLMLLVLLPAGMGCEEKQEKAEQAQPRAVAVETTAVKAETYYETVRGIGTLRATNIVEISPEINGKLTAIHFEEGQKVKKDALLFSLDDRKLKRRLESSKAALADAKAQLAYAEKTLKRFKELTAQGATTEDQLDQAQSDFDSGRADVKRLQAEVQLIREQLADTRIRAPFQGVLSERLVDPGDYVRAGQPLSTLYEEQLEIDFAVPERYLDRVETGQPVDVMVESYPERRFEGTLTYVAPNVYTDTRYFLVKAGIAEREGKLKSGGFATTELVLAELTERPSIPEKALVATRKGYIVYVVENGKAVRREVSVGLRKAGTVEIREGLSIGDAVVTAGHMNLSAGMAVKTGQGGNDGETARAAADDVGEGTDAQ